MTTPSAPYVAHVTFSDAHFRAAVARLRAATRDRRRLLLGRALIGLGVAALFLTGRPWHGFVLLGLAVLAATLPTLLSARLLRRDFERQAHRNQRWAFEWSEEGLRAQTPAHDVRLAWDHVSRAVRFRDGLLVTHDGDTSTWIPDDAYADPSHPDAVFRLVRRHVADVSERP
ncbi:MAG TPA: YcxB family protein [Planctomycetota bacterium]|nr:YcxB family protein [Planctomycetota bacterium]